MWPVYKICTPPPLARNPRLIRAAELMDDHFYTDPKFMKWLASLAPRNELVVRMALKDEIRNPAASKRWNERMLELQHELIETVDDMAELLRDVERAAEEIKRIWPER